MLPFPVEETLPDHKRKLSMSRIRLSTLLLLSVLLLTPAIAAQSTASPVVATINGQPITREQFEAEVRLKEMKSALAHRPNRSVDRAELLNRIISDTLMLQAAKSNDLFPDPLLVNEEMGRILGRFQLSRDEMALLLAGYDLAWADFERSVWEYVKISRFMTGTLLADVSQGKQAYLDAWISKQYEEAELSFDQSFLTAVNARISDLEF
jgi:hypothetical protein